MSGERWTEERLRNWVADFVNENNRFPDTEDMNAGGGPANSTRTQFGGMPGIAVLCNYDPALVRHRRTKEELQESLREWEKTREQLPDTPPIYFANALKEYEAGLLSINPGVIRRFFGGWRNALEESDIIDPLTVDACISLSRSLKEKYGGVALRQLVIDHARPYYDPVVADFTRLVGGFTDSFRSRVLWDHWQPTIWDRHERDKQARKSAHWLSLGVSALVRVEGDTRQIVDTINDMYERKLGPEWDAVPLENLSGLDNRGAARIHYLDRITETYELLVGLGNRSYRHQEAVQQIAPGFIPELTEHKVSLT